ncbi:MULTISPECIES: glycosyltransferase [Rahnella]|uniref:Glycosyltransferase family 4 protein n=1 Tax=Rahnella laticis TaxID=2787622 RepID=A0ABS0E585_9GAMM|nr:MULTISPECIES: glycosyltransferase [Rahnella]MBF7980258.1 glycosyltransferase family 4 protein [Rahnella laticis]MBF8000483.1 glycosyltransferase family 4 protein [Rahnella sp. LAC-M12]
MPFFNVPKGIEFLLSIDMEARFFYPLNIINRTTVYFWWNKVQQKNPGIYSINWVMSSLESDFLQSITPKEWIGKFKQALHQYLQFDDNLLPAIDNRLNDIFEIFQNTHRQSYSPLNVPHALIFLLQCRPDLKSAFNLRVLSGIHALLAWWENEGKEVYVKLSINMEDINNSLVCLKNEHSFYTLPLFIEMLVNERQDIKESFDLDTVTGISGFLEWWDDFGQFDYPYINWDSQDLVLQLQNFCQIGDGVEIPLFIHRLSSERKDLYSAYDIDKLNGLIGLIDWWENDGKVCYPKLSWDVDITLSSLGKNFTFDNINYFPKFINSIIHERKDLQEMFNIKKTSGLLGVLAWWNKNGKLEYPQLNWDSRVLISSLKQIIPVACGLVLPKFIVELPELLHELRKLRLDRVPDILKVIDWWQKNGTYQFDFLTYEICPSEIGLYKPVVHDGINIPRFLIDIFTSRDDLIQAFKTDNLTNIVELIKWWNDYGRLEYQVLQNTILVVSKNNTILIKTPVDDKAFGLNIVGFPQGSLGLGEDARLAGQVIESLGFDGVYINAPISGPPKIVVPDGELRFSETFKYNTSLFCLPPTEMIRLAIEGGEKLINGNEYKIGAWPWELPHWPAAFSQVRKFVDEIWAQSEYVKNCFLKDGNTPVYKMPMAVTVPKPTASMRKELNIADDSFVFYLMFDGNSWLTRKNPLAGVLAFQHAFSVSSQYDNVRLLIKAMNINVSDPTWQKVIKIASADPRIIIITELMDRLSLINMMSSCDCYISLHRSEGFGRVIAEAMLLGQPVVTTNFSGNVDFCRSDTAFLVDGELLPLRKGDYIFYEGQYWCDPDIDIASRQMLTVYEETNLRNKISLCGQTFIREKYSISSVSEFYSERLKEINKYHGS